MSPLATWRPLISHTVTRHMHTPTHLYTHTYSHTHTPHTRTEGEGGIENDEDIEPTITTPWMGTDRDYTYDEVSFIGRGGNAF